MPSATPNSPGRLSLLRRWISDFKLLFALIKDYWKGAYRDISIWSILVFFTGIAYILCPWDILPDTIPGLGQIDDGVVLLLCMYFLEKDLHKYDEWKTKHTLPKTSRHE